MSKQSNKPARDYYQETTDRIIEQLEKGVGQFRFPWHGRAELPLRHNGAPYKGTNVLLLWLSATVNGYTAPRWVTFQQALELGGNVRKGEKSTPVVYFNTWTPDSKGEASATSETTGDEKSARKVAFLKQYHVFNAQQCEGLPPEFFVTAGDAPKLGGSLEDTPIARDFFAAIPAKVNHGGSRAFYSRTADEITLPNWESFRDAMCYMSVRAHESIHWSGSPSRLHREKGERFGDATYAAEELIAELGAAFCLAAMGLSAEPREDHAQYLASWLELLKADKKAIFTAAHAASVAADYLLAFSAASRETVDALAIA